MVDHAHHFAWLRIESPGVERLFFYYRVSGFLHKDLEVIINATHQLSDACPPLIIGLMHPGTPTPRVKRFGIFELDESAGELRRNGTLIRLPPQPFQILRLLIDHAGEVIDRDRIRQEIWNGTAVDFDRSLNVAIAQIRSALHDDAASPRFVQTIPRRGYRFLATVDGDAPIGGEPLQLPRAAKRSWRLAAAVGFGLALAAILSAGAFRYWRGLDGPIRIAVLPFDKVSLDPADVAWSEGAFDDLLTELGGIQPHRIAVIGRLSVYRATGGGQANFRDVSKQLNVNYVLESNIWREGGFLRLATRLVDSGTEAVRWSATFAQDSPPAAFEETIVARVSAGVLSTLFPAASPAKAVTLCQDAEDAFQIGRMLVNRGTLKDLEGSLPFFLKAGCAPAIAERAEVLVRLARIGSASADWEIARSAAQTALGADANLGLAHLAMGNVAFWHDWNWPIAERELREALRINPSNPDAHHDLAWLQTALGLRGDAVASLETAIALDPLSARTRMDSAWLFLQLGQFKRAASEGRRALQLNPGLNEARFCISRALLYAGDVRSAVEALMPLMPQSLISEIAAFSPGDAMRRLIEFQAASAKSDSYQRAWQLALIGSRPEGLTALEQAFAERNPMMPLIAADPAFRTIRAEPRFRSLVSRMGL
jgi:DNA-binding winged helix-turn-helix (wHTH) protein/TolB-like protein/tetratricopeptide (TPR) repeat protein